MNIANIIAGLATAATGILAGILAYIKFFAERRDTKKARSFEAILDKKLAPIVERQDKIVERLEAIEERNAAIETRNAAQDTELREIRLDTLRTQMYLKFFTDSHNHDTIFKIADAYFCHYHGDWVATVDFQAWADKEKVKIPQAILDAIARNHSK